MTLFSGKLSTNHCIFIVDFFHVDELAGGQKKEKVLQKGPSYPKYVINKDGK